MYPKVKVREEIEEADQYDYERSSLQSLKGFQWLSLDHYSSGESQASIARIPDAFFRKSPTPGFQASKDKNKGPLIDGSNKCRRAMSAPRLHPRPVSSSPDRDWSRSEKMRELLSPLKCHNSCVNRHARCKIYEDAEIVAQPQPRCNNNSMHSKKKEHTSKRKNNCSRTSVKQ